MVLTRIGPLVDSQFKSAKMGKGFLFFLLPTVLSLIVFLLSGFTIDIIIFGASFVRELVYYLTAGLLLYILLIVFKGKGAKLSFKAVLSAFSVTYLVTFVASLLLTIVIFISVPGFFSAIARLQAQQASFDQAIAAIYALNIPTGILLWVVYFIFFVVILGAVLANLGVIYRIGQLARKTSSFSNVVFVVLFLALSYLLSFVVNYVLTLL